MIFSALKLVSKTVTIVSLANTGYVIYKKSKVAYGAFNKTKKVKKNIGSLIYKIQEINKVIKR
ncbi:hypothetical protein GW796_06265 [archaeon]|nr:hypothetical protein [archaeon]